MQTGTRRRGTSTAPEGSVDVGTDQVGGVCMGLEACGPDVRAGGRPRRTVRAGGPCTGAAASAGAGTAPVQSSPRCLPGPLPLGARVPRPRRRLARPPPLFPARAGAAGARSERARDEEQGRARLGAKRKGRATCSEIPRVDSSGRIKKPSAEAGTTKDPKEERADGARDDDQGRA